MSMDTNTDTLVTHQRFALSRSATWLNRGDRDGLPFWKLAMDKTIAALVLLMVAPIFLIVAAVILLRDGNPVFFGHSRVGRNGRTFRCYKFRTMVRDADVQLSRLLAIDPIAREEWQTERKLTRDPRVNAFGRLLRKSSIDELPQLWNVLRGDMSLVGPRPVTSDESEKYGDAFSTYTKVRPGVTGAWQVSGRNETSYADRVKLDVDYVQTQSLRGDITILAKTAGVVLFGTGAS